MFVRVYASVCVRISARVGVGVRSWTRFCERIVPPSLALRSALLASSTCAAAAGPRVLPTGVRARGVLRQESHFHR